MFSAGARGNNRSPLALRFYDSTSTVANDFKSKPFVSRMPSPSCDAAEGGTIKHRLLTNSIRVAAQSSAAT